MAEKAKNMTEEKPAMVRFWLWQCTREAWLICAILVGLMFIPLFLVDIALSGFGNLRIWGSTLVFGMLPLAIFALGAGFVGFLVGAVYAAIHSTVKHLDASIFENSHEYKVLSNALMSLLVLFLCVGMAWILAAIATSDAYRDQIRVHPEQLIPVVGFCIMVVIFLAWRFSRLHRRFISFYFGEERKRKAA